MTFTGYASVFDGVDSYGDTIEKGAYAKTISDGHHITMEYQHYEGVIGKWVKLQEDDHGLLVTGELTPGHSLAQDVYALMKHEAINGLSIGYRAKAWEATDDERRILKEIELDEISVVSRPADNEARVGTVKTADLFQITNYADAEQILRESGLFSRKAALTFVEAVKRLSGESESHCDAASEIRATLARLQNRKT